MFRARALSCLTLATLPFTVTANVINDCTIVATHINFGTAGALGTTVADRRQPVAHSLYARVLPQTTAQAGTYIDTVIATITH
ncbi:hypothetical protein [Paraburkholderia terricola]|uniref:Spore coat protein U-like protein n=1 Tax=Paraburkholderia terricola TaxID=169427 RepID=A0ABU1M1G9_9BURK|nr:hypothetical protein [Paraburkholderia terricola]MDR6412852.1 spore coat protein U-like protein [Paraburkholderia terricola]MDR6484787.1 spore coat protein U-like protein [Paraburkholderia terricola]